MTETDTSSSQSFGESSPATARGPGAALRSAREASGKSQADVSQIIRFSVRQIEALESDDFDNLPGPTVVRGFIRSYAKLLKIDAGPLLAMLEPIVPVAQSDVRAPTNMGDATHASPALQLPLRLIAFGMIGVSLVLMLVWIASTLNGDRHKESLPAKVAESGTNPEKVTAPVAVLLSEIPNAGLSGAAVESGTTEASPVPPHAGLRLEFDERSWVEVRDARQQVVFVGEYPGGTRQNINGAGPFYLWVGKASGIRVFFGERNIDLKPHTREDVARLTVE